MSDRDDQRIDRLLAQLIVPFHESAIEMVTSRLEGLRPQRHIDLLILAETELYREVVCETQKIADFGDLWSPAEVIKEMRTNANRLVGIAAIYLHLAGITGGTSALIEVLDKRGTTDEDKENGKEALIGLAKSSLKGLKARNL